MITKDISVDGSEYKLTLTDQVLNQVDNLKALYATAAEDPESFEQVSSEISAAINNISESVSPEISDGHLDGLIQEVFKAVPLEVFSKFVKSIHSQTSDVRFPSEVVLLPSNAEFILDFTPEGKGRKV